MTTLILRGVDGVIQGEVFPLNPGESAVIGRSSSCEISLKTFLDAPDETSEADKRDRAFMSVSREHLRITYHHPENVEIKDLSKNGTFLDGKRIDEASLQDVASNTYLLRLGKRETFSLKVDDLDVGGGSSEAQEKDGA